VNNTSGSYFDNRPCIYTGPEPRKPLVSNWLEFVSHAPVSVYDHFFK
jgi:hypothetical protein